MKIPLTLIAFLTVSVAVFDLHGAGTSVVLLGTGTPNPDPKRSGPAVAVISGGKTYLFDSGPGVVRRAVEAGIRPEAMTRLFLTHLHSDHTVGLPDLMFTPAVMGRTGLKIYGPQGTKVMVDRIASAWQEDVAIRLHGGEPSVADAYRIETLDLAPDEVYRDENVVVVAFLVNHGSWKQAFGYRVEAKDKVIVISGDTAVSENLVRHAGGCDILVHEVYCAKGWEKRPPPWRAYHARYHTPAPDLGLLAAKLKPGKLVLYHQLLMGMTVEDLLAEIRQHYDGVVIYGNDLDVID